MEESLEEEEEGEGKECENEEESKKELLQKFTNTPLKVLKREISSSNWRIQEKFLNLEVKNEGGEVILIKKKRGEMKIIIKVNDIILLKNTRLFLKSKKKIDGDIELNENQNLEFKKETKVYYSRIFYQKKKKVQEEKKERIGIPNFIEKRKKKKEKK